MTRQWERSSPVNSPEMIEFDYREIEETAEEEKLDFPEPLPNQAPLPEPEYKEEPIPPPSSEVPPIDQAVPEIEEVTLPPAPATSRTTEITPAIALGRYISYLQDIVDQQLEYPQRGSREGREGKVTVLFTLDRTGRLLALSIPIEGRSDFHPFNRAALNAVRRGAQYFGQFPEIITELTITFSLPIRFTL